MKKQSGFTLIELVIVIIILGILAATAVPKFVDLEGDAQGSALQGLKAAIEAATTLTNSVARIERKKNRTGESTRDGVELRYGYPDSTAGGIEKALDLSGSDWTINHAGRRTTFTPFVEAGQTALRNCNVIYTRTNNADTRPEIVATTTGC